MNKIERLFQITNFIDSARWQADENTTGQINYYAPRELCDDEKILTHWLCYVTDRQTPFTRIWEVGGFIFSQLVHAVKTKKDLSLLDPKIPGSFFIKTQDYERIYRTNLRRDGYLFVSSQPVGKNKLLKKNGFESQEVPYFVSRYYPSDYKAILSTLVTLKSYDFNIMRYMKTALDIIDIDSDESIRKLLFSLYQLTYRDIGRISASKISFRKLLREAEKRSEEVNSLLNDKEKFHEEYNRFRRSQIYYQKRAWCSLRDYLKAPEFRPLFLSGLKKEGFKSIKKLSSLELLEQLELPGDVWNNNPIFRNCILENTKYKRETSDFPQLLRRIYEENSPSIGYPEQFDITFDFVSRMCEEDNCSICPYGLLNGKARDFVKVCISKGNYFCPVLLGSCGYKIMCKGNGCEIRKMIKRR